MSKEIRIIDNETVRETFLEALRRGASEVAACAAVHEDPNNFYKLKAEARYLLGENKKRPAWMPLGHESDRRRAKEITEFYQDVQAAEASVELYLTSYLMDQIAAGKASFRDVLALLSKRFPKWQQVSDAVESGVPEEEALQEAKTQWGQETYSAEHWDKVIEILHEIEARKARGEAMGDILPGYDESL